MLSLTTPAVLAASEPHYVDIDTDTVKALIIDRAIAHGVNPDTLLCVVYKESKFNPNARGKMGEYGLAQWLPGRLNAWDYTLAAQQGIDIVREYEARNIDAVYYDADGLAELFSRGRAYIAKHWPRTSIGC